MEVARQASISPTVPHDDDGGVPFLGRGSEHAPGGVQGPRQRPTLIGVDVRQPTTGRFRTPYP
jgi:hypothetical protein